jgi:hypothetical protein
MRANPWALVAACSLALPTAALAQTPAAPAKQTSRTTVVTQTTAYTEVTPTNNWYASGFAGSNFGAAAASSSVDFGGALGYLYRGYVGGEFLAGFTPNFQMQGTNVLAGQSPDINSYMVNLIAAAPLGVDNRFQPYVSGGIGAVTLSASNVVSPAVGVNAVLNPTAAKFGGDIGAGLMAYAGNVGVRGDVRYYRAFNTSNNGTSAESVLGESALAGLDFWRANVGLAFRW